MTGNGQSLTANDLATMQQAAQNGMTSAPQAGSNPLVTPNAPVVGPAQQSSAPAAGGPINVTQSPVANSVNNGAAPGQNPYSAFIQALDQIQSAMPVTAVGQDVPPAKKSSASQQATMEPAGQMRAYEQKINSYEPGVG